MAKLYILSKEHIESGQRPKTPREQQKSAQQIENEKLEQELKSIKDYVASREEYLQGEICRIHERQLWWKSTCFVLSIIMIAEHAVMFYMWIK